MDPLPGFPVEQQLPCGITVGTKRLQLFARMRVKPITTIGEQLSAQETGALGGEVRPAWKQAGVKRAMFIIGIEQAFAVIRWAEPCAFHQLPAAQDWNPQRPLVQSREKALIETTMLLFLERNHSRMGHEVL